jgi:hypothetical protein
MMSFIKTHMFSIMCILGLIWLAEVIATKLRYKKKGTALTGRVVANKTVTGNLFPVYEFYFEGETLQVDSYEAVKDGVSVGTEETIYYVPGNKKGVFREEDLKLKPWMLIVSVLAAAYIIVDFAVIHK